MQTAKRRQACAAVVVLIAAACTPATPPPPGPPAAVGPLRASEPFGVASVTLHPPDGGDGVVVPVYDAYVPSARARGLMYRDRLPAGTGMVFRYPGPSSGGFYMKNTLIPLSIAFFDAGGTVVGVFDMTPCKTDPCPTYEPRSTYTGALEVNQGFFDQLGLEPGWRIELPPGLPPAR